MLSSVKSEKGTNYVQKDMTYTLLTLAGPVTGQCKASIELHVPTFRQRLEMPASFLLIVQVIKVRM